EVAQRIPVFKSPQQRRLAGTVVTKNRDEAYVRRIQPRFDGVLDVGVDRIVFASTAAASGAERNVGLKYLRALVARDEGMEDETRVEKLIFKRADRQELDLSGVEGHTRRIGAESGIGDHYAF